MPAKKALFKIGDLSRLFHIGQDSIRYYERVGLLHPVRDPSSNYRTYTIDDIRTMNTVRELLDLGFSTDEILTFERDRNIRHVTEMLETESTRIQNQIRVLEKKENKYRWQAALHPGEPGAGLQRLCLGARASCAACTDASRFLHAG